MCLTCLHCAHLSVSAGRLQWRKKVCERPTVNQNSKVVSKSAAGGAETLFARCYIDFSLLSLKKDPRPSVLFSAALSVSLPLYLLCATTDPLMRTLISVSHNVK